MTTQDDADPRTGVSVTHRRYVPYSHAHYAGNLVDGAYVLAMFGDVATELLIRTDGDEGLFASYSDVQFVLPVQGGDVLEATATVVRVGRRSRELANQTVAPPRRPLCRSPSSAPQPPGRWSSPCRPDGPGSLPRPESSGHRSPFADLVVTGGLV
jgi:3-aminobutyryl-CoA ammonia-lyase